MLTIVAALSRDDDNKSRAELDSHVDYPVIGKNALTFEDAKKNVTVIAFTNTLGTCCVTVVNVCTTYKNDQRGSMYSFLVYSTLYVKK